MSEETALHLHNESKVVKTAYNSTLEAEFNIQGPQFRQQWSVVYLVKDVLEI